MKHILPILTAALALTATSAFAAFNWEISVDPFPNNGYADHYTIKVNEGTGKIYINDFLNTWNDYPNQNDSIASRIDAYGYSYVATDDPTKELNKPVWKSVSSANLVDGSLIDEKLDSFDRNPAIVIDRYGYELGTFTAGDEVEIWMKKGTAEVGSNSHNGPSRYNRGDEADQWMTRYYNYDRNKSMEVMPIAQLYPTNDYQVKFSISGAEYVGGGEGGGNGGGTSGAPLPGGVQTALIAGLFALGFWYVRRRKAIAA